VRKRAVPGILLALLLASLLLPPVIAADGGPQITANVANADFPTGVNFSVSAESAAGITDMRLRYRVDRRGFAEVTSEMLAGFTPGDRVSATAELDLRITGGFPPGTELDYWWVVTDSSGVETVTASMLLPSLSSILRKSRYFFTLGNRLNVPAACFQSTSQNAIIFSVLT